MFGLQSLFYICDGSVGVYITSAEAPDKEIRVERRYRGTLVGEFTFFMGSPRCAFSLSFEPGGLHCFRSDSNSNALTHPAHRRSLSLLCLTLFLF